MSQKLYFKITNENECHYGFQYKDGLNILEGEFNNNPKDICVPGRLYFSDSKNICGFLDFGIYLREVYLPTDNPKLQMIKDPEGDKYGANMIILGKRRDLRDPETWKYLISVGIDIHSDNDYALIWASKEGYLEILKFLVENGVDIHIGDENSLKWASKNGHFEIVKYLVENGANIHAKYDKAYRKACKNNHQKIIEYLKKNGAKSCIDYGFRKDKENLIIYFNC
ncbi:ankyrin repeat protein [Moumouvirus australiensis]|uniref:Ankyrin repeat protein n=1 Tax=Moumouvirus australiensis TaxID=2109587 RepID=A0A2P1EKP6_9VIRU|nr:ankyrin repeat protein [Moumouvirus australiensis]AVL94466.1 ankyrin repeat protein [Moumouvirus australiensis]